jgi:hypothetical protein
MRLAQFAIDCELPFSPIRVKRLVGDGHKNFAQGAWSSDAEDGDS